MNPKKANDQMSEKIKELNVSFQDGQAAKEMTQTSYFQHLKEVIKKQIVMFEENKVRTSYMSLCVSARYKNQDGTYYTVPPEDARISALCDEAYIQSRKDILKMIDNDVASGDDAYKELEIYKSKIKL